MSWSRPPACFRRMSEVYRHGPFAAPRQKSFAASAARPASNNQILAIIVSQTGLIRHKVLQISQPIAIDRLETISDYAQ